jgi:hypothetical protein
MIYEIQNFRREVLRRYFNYFDPLWACAKIVNYLIPNELINNTMKDQHWAAIFQFWFKLNVETKIVLDHDFARSLQRNLVS